MDERINRDINRLSTADLVLCWALLNLSKKEAIAGRTERMVHEFSARMRAIDAELARRQGQLFETSAASPEPKRD